MGEIKDMDVQLSAISPKCGISYSGIESLLYGYCRSLLTSNGLLILKYINLANAHVILFLYPSILLPSSSPSNTPFHILSINCAILFLSCVLVCSLIPVSLLPLISPSIPNEHLHLPPISCSRCLHRYQQLALLSGDELSLSSHRVRRLNSGR